MRHAKRALLWCLLVDLILRGSASMSTSSGKLDSDAPWALTLQMAPSRDARPVTQCGAVAIGTYEVITAAHCVQLPALFVVWDPVTNRHLRIVEVLYHASYGSPRLANDIALIRLADPVSAVAEPTTELESAAGISASALRLVLQEASGPTLGAVTSEPAEAVRRFGAVFDGHRMLAVRPRAGRGTCSGDSGAPLVRVDKGTVRVVGLISYGLSTCDSGTSVVTSVGAYEQWLTAARGKLSSRRSPALAVAGQPTTVSPFQVPPAA